MGLSRSDFEEEGPTTRFGRAPESASAEARPEGVETSTPSVDDDPAAVFVDGALVPVGFEDALGIFAE